MRPEKHHIRSHGRRVCSTMSEPTSRRGKIEVHGLATDLEENILTTPRAPKTTAKFQDGLERRQIELLGTRFGQCSFLDSSCQYSRHQDLLSNQMSRRQFSMSTGFGIYSIYMGDILLKTMENQMIWRLFCAYRQVWSEIRYDSYDTDKKTLRVSHQ